VRALAALLQALVPALLMNICIVGLNQVFDVRIDRVNKPYLPLASGEFSMQTGVGLVRRSSPPAQNPSVPFHCTCIIHRHQMLQLCIG
jgi:hypothetical protein